MNFDLYKGFNFNITESSVSSRLDQMREKEKTLTEIVGKHLAEMIKVYAEEQYQKSSNLRNKYDSSGEYLQHEKDILIEDFVSKFKKYVNQQVIKNLKNK
jgi:hypothetical protein